MVLVLVVMLLAITAMQTVQIFGMFGEANQVKAQFGTGTPTGQITYQQPVAQQQGPQQPSSIGIGGC